jgi:cobalamin-dependent methionine synthase I
VYELHEVQSAPPEAVHLAHGVTFRGQRLAQAMRHAREAAIFVLTLGERVTEATRELAGEDPFESYLLDSVASILVETVADRFQTLLEERMNQQGAWGGFRYSPGYCDWPTEENRALLHTIDAQSIGVRLTTGGMMSPPKTISGIIPYGGDSEKIQFNPCTGCPRIDCDHRRK